MKARVKETGEIIEVDVSYGFYVKSGTDDIYGDDALDFTLSEPEEEVTIEGYIARDEDGALSLFPIKPFRDYADINDVCRGFWDSITDYSIKIPKDEFLISHG